MLHARDYFSAEDYAWIENLSEYWFGEESYTYVPFTEDDHVAGFCSALADRLLGNDPLAFERLLEQDDADTNRCYANPTFARLVVMGLEYGVACEDGACANWLGAMYYLGTVVEPDYLRAKELYELAERKGVERAMLNLGYVYEYGRCGAPDYLKAFMQYAKVAALTGHTEALYKMGDMYSRAKAVERDMRSAWRLYESSLEAAGKDVVAQAQPAFRIAELVSNKEMGEFGIPYDPMRALALYQLAERGLRIDIAHGQTYYARRLQQAIAGQERMREVLDGPDVVL